MSNSIPDEVRRFVLTSVPSVPYLEALLLLRGEPAARWDAWRLAGRLYIGETHALELLQALTQAGIAARTEDGSFGFAPAAPELVAILDAVARTYAQDLVGVTDLIHSGLKRAHQFADAFRFRKDGK